MIEKVKVESSVLGIIDQITEKENDLVRSFVGNEHWIKENVLSIYSDDNTYFLDMGEERNSKKILLKIESFKLMLNFLKFLSKVDSMTLEDAENEEFLMESLSEADKNLIETYVSVFKDDLEINTI
ncbi:hypothetical protein EBU94_03570 [bacterium]|nr:hypothetical protein [bacterium]